MSFKGRISGKGQLNLGNKDFLASGGEGSVYQQKGLAYKVYTDQKKMIPVKKIQELSDLDMPNIIRPLDIILDDKDVPSGYSMAYLSNTGALCQLFTKAFRDRHHITHDMIIKLVQRMQETHSFIHSRGKLLVDNNEMNFLVDSVFQEVYFIDVDSYQTPSFPATAIMESIRDRHCNNQWSQLTDWFSFGIVTFQMFIGIHPYKGKHPKLNGFDDRMLANASVFNKNVVIPKVCYPFDVIPQSYREWYKAVFEDGKRVPPPTGLIPVIMITTQVKKISGTNNFDIKELLVASDTITDYVSANGIRVMIAGDTIYINDKASAVKAKHADSSIAVTPKNGKVILGHVDGKILELFNVNDNADVNVRISADSVMATCGRMYFKSGGMVYEVVWHEGANVLASSHPIANVHENATKLFEGVAMQNLFGVHWATIFPRTKESYSIQLKEIKGQIIDAKYSNNVLMVNAIEAGKYSRYVFRFADNFSTYDVQSANDLTFTGLNFVVVDTGICCSLNENEDLVLRRNKKNDALTKVISDPELNGNMHLYANGTNVIFSQNNILYSIKLK